MEGEEAGGGVWRAEIDTSAPFRSVKEAVMLFGEKVLAGEVYANKFSEIRAAASRNDNGNSRLESIVAELEEAKQNLEYEREERIVMETSLMCLREELEKTKVELGHLKSKESEKQVIVSEIEDLKFVKESTEFVLDLTDAEEANEFQRRRYVKFADPPSLSQVLNIPGNVLERQCSMDEGMARMEMKKKKKKKKKKPLMSLLQRAFSTKKKNDNTKLREN